MIGSNNEEQCKKILQKWNFQTARKLGKGSFGHVLLTSKFVNSASVFYAVKCISLKKCTKDPKHKLYLQQEAETMREFNHPHIVKLENTFTQCGWYFFVLEYCDMGNLLQYQAKLPGKAFVLPEAIKIFHQILKGVQTIHSKNILHRDIKCENIFLKKKKNGGFECKIGDFGFAKIVEETTKTSCGTTLYMAPEVLAVKPYEFKADIWSLGVIFFQMIFGEYPFKSLNIEKQINDKCVPSYKITEYQNLDLRFPKKYCGQIEDFFRRIFTVNPENRISLMEVIEHPLIRNLDEASSDSTTDDVGQSEVEWQKNRIKYIQRVFAEVKREKILEPHIEEGFNFYLNKVIKSFLREASIQKYLQEQPHTKLAGEIKAIKALNDDQLYTSMKFLEDFAGSMAKIPNFYDGFTLSYEEFNSFKQGYRNMVGIVYEELHKKIPDFAMRSRLKFKIFTCHLINRIFKTGVKKEIFPIYQKWLKSRQMKPSNMINFDQFEEWVRKEQGEKLVASIEEINNIFYRKD